MNPNEQQFVTEILAICDANPDRVNPLLPDGGCAYTSATDPTHHCLIGQWCVEKGFPVPDDPDNPEGIAVSAFMALEGMVSDKAVRRLAGEFQGIADGPAADDGDYVLRREPLTWAEVANRIRSEYGV